MNQMNADDRMGTMPPEQNCEVTSSTSAALSNSRIQEIVNLVKTDATVEKIEKIRCRDPKTVHDGLKSTAEKYVEEYLESNSAMQDSLENILDEMLLREQRLKQEGLQDTSFSNGQKTIVDKQDDIARELLASSTVLQNMDFREMLENFKENHTKDESLKGLDQLLLKYKNM